MSQAMIDEAVAVLAALDFPRAQLNERTGLTLLALLDLRPGRVWGNATNPLMGITPIMDWARDHYGAEYKPNTRETFRRQSMHQFVDAGIASYNPDNPSRPVNSPKAVYQITPAALTLLQNYGRPEWQTHLGRFLAQQGGLAAHYAHERQLAMVPVVLGAGQILALSPGGHNLLIKAIIEQFAPRFAQNSVLIYVGDTGQKWGFFDQERLNALGVRVDTHGKMPDVILHDIARNWLLLIESVSSHGPVDGKRHDELARLFAGSTAGLVYITAFPTRAVMAKYAPLIAWETEVWVAEDPGHLIHYNGVRFLGPYPTR